MSRFVLLLSLAALSSPSHACERYLLPAKSLPEAYAKLEAQARAHKYFDQVRVIPAVARVLRKYLERGLQPPVLQEMYVRDRLKEEEGALDAVWLERVLPTYGNIPRLEVGEIRTQLFSSLYGTEGADNSVVYLIEIDGRPHVFRPAAGNGVHVLRKTLAAAELVEMLGTESAPRAFPAYVNGSFGVVSEFAHGQPVDRVTAMSGKFGRAEAFANAQIAEFIISNSDARPENFHVDEQGGIKIHDHTHGFHTEIQIVFDLDPYPFGATLPEAYPAPTAAKVLAADLGAIEARIGRHLTPLELYNTLFRVEVVRDDIAR